MAARSKALRLALLHNQSAKERTMKTVEIVNEMQLETAADGNGVAWVDITIHSISEDRATHQRTFRMSQTNAQNTILALQIQLDRLKQKSGPTH